MKGIVFVKLGEFIEETWGDWFWDELISEANLPSQGAYTSVGTYDDEELQSILGLIEIKKQISVTDAQLAFGKWVFIKLYQAAPPDAHNFTDLFEFLHGVQNVIHVEVKKLNPDALLPEFEFIDQTEKTLTLKYISPRRMSYFCEGLIMGLSEFLKQPVKVTRSHDQGEECILMVEKLDG